MVHIHIDRLELAVGAGDEIVAPGDGGAHFLQYVGETDVALYAVAADTGDFYRAALNGASGEEIRGRGSIAFHQVISRRLILLLAAHHKSLIRLIVHLNAEGFHQVQRNVDIGFRHQIALNDDDGILRRQRRGHQQRGQELAGDAAVNLDVAALKTAAQAQRWIIFLLQTVDLSAALTQGIHQMADRTLFHPRFAGQHDIVAAKAQSRRQRTHRGTGVAKEQLQRRGRAQRAAVAGHFAAGAVGRQGILNPQRTQGIQHMAHIVAVQQVGQHRRAAGQGSQQQRAVGDAFRTWQVHGALYACDGL